MAEVMFDTELGYSISDEETGLDRWACIAVDGVPGDAGLDATQLALVNGAPVGSSSIDTTTGKHYRKKLAGAGTDKWVGITDDDETAAAVSPEHWLDPAKVKDDTVYANLAAAETAVNTGTIDGITIADGDQILFTGITGSNKHVYTVTGTPGSGATLVEISNTLTNNDAILIDEGTSAGCQFHYNSTLDAWVKSSQTSLDELGFIRGFIGKTAGGSETPDYTTNNFVANGDTLEVATGKLDAQVKTNQDDIATATSSLSTIQTEVDDIEGALGAAVDATGAYVPHAGTNYLDTNADITEDLLDLDAQVKANADAIAVGASQGNSVTGITALTEVDSVLVDEVKLVKWYVHVQQGNKVRGIEVLATHDGTNAADAVSTDWTRYARLRLNGNIPGYGLSVVVEGAGVAQKLVLKAKANAGIDVAAIRETVLV